MNPYLIPGLEAAPVVCRRLIERIPAARLDEPLARDRFTAREVIAHLADWEPIMRDRIRTACTAPGARLTVYDESAMALTKRYSQSDPVAQCGQFQRERQATVALIRGLSPATLRNTVVHPERGILSGDDLANLLLGHDLYHIEQLSAYLAAAPAPETP